MSIFFCEGHQALCDSDFVEFIIVGDKWYCEDCTEEINLDESPNVLTLEDAAAIVKPLFYNPPGLGLYWSPGKQLTDEEKDAMDKRVCKSFTFLEWK